MNWIKPEFLEKRFGFEITMYIGVKTSPKSTKSMFLQKTNVGVLACLLLLSSVAQAADDWLFEGQNIQNTRYNPNSTQINKYNIKNLQLKWVYESPVPLAGNIGFRSSPVIKDGKMYIGDISGYLHGIDEATGLSLSGYPIYLPSVSLNKAEGPDIKMTVTKSPAIIGDKIVVSGWKTFSQASTGVCINGQHTSTSPPLSGTCTPRIGAVVSVFDRNTGSLVWSTIVDRFYSARITTSPVVYNNVVYVGVSSGEEQSLRQTDRSKLTGDPADAGKPYPCCGHKGSVVALDLTTGNILWKTYMAPLDYDPLALQPNDPKRTFFTQPDPERPPIANFKKWTNNARLNFTVFPAIPAIEAPVNTAKDLIDYNLNSAGFSGNSVWGGSNFAIDAKRGVIYIGSSNGYNAPRAYKECRLFRINPNLIADPDISVFGVPGKTKCSQLKSLDEINQRVGYFSANIVTLDLLTGEIKSTYSPQEYDVWQFVCTQPELGLAGWLDSRTPAFPTPTTANGGFTHLGNGANLLNCPNMIQVTKMDIDPCATGNTNLCQANVTAKIRPELVGKDAAFAQGPMLISLSKKNHKTRDIVAASDKDAIFVALDPDKGLEPLPSYRNQNVDELTGQPRDGVRLGPGGVLGGVHISGAGFDGRYAYYAISNSKNVGRDVTKPFVQSMYDIHRSYEDPFNDNMIADAFHLNDPNSFIRIIDSGPRELWKLTNPPKDVEADATGRLIPSGDGFSCYVDPLSVERIGSNATFGLPIAVVKVTGTDKVCRHIANRGDLVTISGIYTKVDVLKGKIRWQRPTIEVIPEALNLGSLPKTIQMFSPLGHAPNDHRGRGLVFGGGITLANGILYTALFDQQSSFLGMDTKDGKLLFECHGTTGPQNLVGGDVTGAPTIVGDSVYFSNGSDIYGNPFLGANGLGNRIFAFHLGSKTSSNPIVCKNLNLGNADDEDMNDDSDQRDEDSD